MRPRKVLVKRGRRSRLSRARRRIQACRQLKPSGFTGSAAPLCDNGAADGVSAYPCAYTVENKEYRKCLGVFNTSRRVWEMGMVGIKIRCHGRAVRETGMVFFKKKGQREREFGIMAAG